MRPFYCLIVTLTLLLSPLDARPCKYWCKTHENHYYCCPTGHPEESNPKDPTATKPKDPSPWSTPTFWIHVIGSLVNWHRGEHATPHEAPHEDYHQPKLHCPPVRSICPRTWNSAPPKLCDFDAACGAWEKCCYDVCLDHKVCKPAE